MNFDYTNISLFGLTIYEPMVIVTNFILLLLSVYCYKRLMRFKKPYPTEMALFIIIMGISGCFGATAHAAHYQMGKTVFNIIFFISNTLNLLAIYFCFKASYTYFCLGRKRPDRTFIGLIWAWMAVLIVITIVNNTFLMIKIHAGIALVYSLIIHLLAFRRNREKGSAVIVWGIIVSFLSIVVHSLKISVSENFNYKDIAHVIMIVALAVIFKGIDLNSERLYRQSSAQVPG